MTLQNNLIPIIAKAYRIERGTTEPVEQWRMRVIYSMLGQMAYASLWDVEENEQPVSVVHFKSRMKKLIESYALKSHRISCEESVRVVVLQELMY